LQEFTLVPFSSDTAQKLKITGEIIRSSNKLFLRYKVEGEINQILLPAKAPSPSRTEDLWKSTCFEFFLALPDQPEYWEFNMSPSGDWNVYKMDAYRRVGFREETAFQQIPFVFGKNESILSLDISVDLTPIIATYQPVKVGITAIIPTENGNETFWALAHPGIQADFHLRESFSLTV